MPELLTKHPDVALQVLKSQGAQCGAGIKPKILTSCPQEKFCTLQGGELCIYGPQELGLMSQLTRAEVCGHASPKAAVSPAGAGVGLVPLGRSEARNFVARFACEGDEIPGLFHPSASLHGWSHFVPSALALALAMTVIVAASARRRARGRRRS